MSTSIVHDEADERDEADDPIGNFLDAGWGRWLPLIALDVLMAVEEAATGGGNVADPATGPTNARLFQEGGLGMSAFAGEEEDTTADGGETLQMRRHATDVVARACGVAPIGTLSDLIDLMCKLRIIGKQELDGETKWCLGNDIPSVLALPLPQNERKQEERVQWQRRYYPLSQEIIALFMCADHAPIPPPGFQPGKVRATLATTLGALGNQLGATPEDVREAIAVLEDEGDFSCTPRVGKLKEADRLTIALDWVKFKEGRIGLAPSPEFLPPP